MDLLIRNVSHEGKIVNIFVSKGKIDRISDTVSESDLQGIAVLEGDDNYIFPMLHNGHTHSPMVLLRGYGDDMVLDEWLNTKIWPAEARLTEEDYYWGNRLALVEMIKNGTGFFNEMYMNPRSMVKALIDFPLKARIHFPLIDGMDVELAKKQITDCSLFFENTSWTQNVKGGVALHSVYANSEYSLKWAGEYARRNNLPLHIHLCETEQEIENCRQKNQGQSPVEYLEKLDFFRDNKVFAAHCLWLDESDIDILSGHGVIAVHNPVSNMKLAAGRVFPYSKLKDKGVPVVLGTDGAASNNNLDLLEEMKIASLLQKHHSGDPTLMSADEAFSLSSGPVVSQIFETGSGKIETGSDADFIIINRKSLSMTPATNIKSNLIYSASGHDILHMILQGEILMKDRMIRGEETVVEMAHRRAEILLKS
ncbi:amidohydrolase family protein [Spirochaeta isovalerica]|uniref:5-methylthioadenosine/S-adenosylhomocysteine deaminase n=1 Tax=Spirochaeta isovalerica TaxID=150 RepID=A0A841R4Y1_9SPIO|nr:amidohydrolase [Spirochaeta isovalerica]MBB6478853.1 5-methylthioadenosine/S-adenosylhomocysteine deaminase [Spirochaeta isovalerica]